MARYSKRLAHRADKTRSVLSAVTVWRQELAGALDGECTALGLTPPPEAVAHVETLARALAARAERMEAAEHRLAVARANDLLARRARDEAFTGLQAVVLNSRSVLLAFIGPAAIERYGLQGRTPRTPEALANAIRNTGQLMKGHAPSVELPGVGRLEVSALASRLEEALAPLQAAIATVRDTSATLDEALGARDRAVAAWNRTYQSVTSILVALLRLGGHDALADRLRPVTRGARRAARSAEPSPTPEPADA